MLARRATNGDKFADVSFDQPPRASRLLLLGRELLRLALLALGRSLGGYGLSCVTFLGAFVLRSVWPRLPGDPLGRLDRLVAFDVRNHLDDVASRLGWSAEKNALAWGDDEAVGLRASIRAGPDPISARVFKFRVEPLGDREDVGVPGLFPKVSPRRLARSHGALFRGLGAARTAASACPGVANSPIFPWGLHAAN